MKMNITCISLFILLSCTDSKPRDSEMQTVGFFSIKEIIAAGEGEIAPLQSIEATDKIALAFRAYLPNQAKAVLIFYHGAGVHSGINYNHIGVGLRDEFNIAVFMPDIRGHGSSGGERGDTPDTEQVWSDISSIIQHVRLKYPALPLYLGGHSGGAGLSLNYSSWDNNLPVDGYVFTSPYFGYRAQTKYDEGTKNTFEIATVNTNDFIQNAMSGGKLKGHSKAIQFSFPESSLKKYPKIVPFMTVNMSNAVTPDSPKGQFSELKRFGLWIGQHDEAFDPVKVVNFAKNNRNKDAENTIQIVAGEYHLSLIIKAHQLIGPWILSQI